MRFLVRLNVWRAVLEKLFRLCSLGAITPEDIDGFNAALEETLKEMHVSLPIQ